MTEPVTAPKTTPAPSITGSMRSSAASVAQAGANLLRPVRYTAAFIEGTLRGGLDGVAIWGRRGLKLGAVAGFGAWMAPATIAAMGWTSLAGIGVAAAGLTGGALIPALVIFGGGAFLAGMAIGGTVGLLKGGMQAVGRMHRGEKYADDLVVRSKMQQAAPHNRADYRQQRKALKAVQGADISRYMQERHREDEADQSTYWQDREQANTNHGRGLW